MNESAAEDGWPNTAEEPTVPRNLILSEMKASTLTPRAFVLWGVGCVFGGLAACVSAQPSSGWSVVGQLGGPVQASAVSGTRAYVGVGLQVEVLDVSNPANPLEIGLSAPLADFVHGLTVSGNIVFAAAGVGGIYAIDFTSPAQPVQLGAWTSTGYAEGVTLNGNMLYVADGPLGLQILDVSNPRQLTPLGAVFTNNYAFQIAVAGTTAVIASAGAGVLIADVSNPAEPKPLSSLALPGYAFGVSIANNLAYVAAGWGGVQVVNLANPASPSLAASVALSGWALAVAAGSSDVYVADGGFGLQIIDEATLRTVGELATGNPIYNGIAVVGGYAYVSDRQTGLWILNVANPAGPSISGSVSTLGLALGVAVMGTTAVISEPSGLAAADISNPSAPVFEGFFPLTNSYPSRVITLGTYAITIANSGNTTALYVIDFSTPSNPVSAGNLPLTGEMNAPLRDAKFVGSRAYIADEKGLLIVDLSQPRQPTLVGFVELDNWPNPPASHATTGIAVSGNYAYLTAPDGLKIVDVSDPSNPTPVGDFTGSTYNYGCVSISGGYAFMSGGGGTSVLNLSNPEQPTLAGYLESPGASQQSQVFGSQLLTADEGQGLGVVNISSPTQPLRDAWVQAPAYSQDICLSGNLALLAANGGGIALLSLGGTGGAAPVFVARHVPAIPAGAVPSVLPVDASPPQIPGISSTSQTITVTSVQDSGAGTLRAALSGTKPGTKITFDPSVFSPTKPVTINLLSALPTIAQGQIVIDASSCGVVLNGANAGGAANGLQIFSSGNAVMGLQIVGFADAAISVQGSNNRIGGDRNVGTGPLGQGNLIGSSPADGIDIYGTKSADNLIQGNLIGVGLQNQALPNFNGISISGGAHANFVGGATPSQQNVVSANQSVGVTILLGSHHNVVAGNLVGTTIDGTRTVGTQQTGVVVDGAPENTIGGADASARNVIAGNVIDGANVKDAGSVGNLIEGNYFSLNSAGNAALPNGIGLNLESGPTHTIIEGNVIGPSASQAFSLGDTGSSFSSLIGNIIGTDATGTVALPGAPQCVIGGGYLTRVGGTSPAERNILAGGLGVGFGWSSAIVLGNFIGTDVTGTRTLSSPYAGVTLESGWRPIIGGCTAAEANLIGGNAGDGVQVNAGSNCALIAGNRIGTGYGGASIGNAQFGVQISYSAGTIVQGNVISGNGSTGVQVVGESANVLRQNSIYSNAHGGISLTSGGNDQLAPPIVSQATSGGVTGAADPGSTIEVYSDAGNEGAIYEGSTVTAANGSFRFTAAAPLYGPNVTVTATDPDGSTSPFSSPVAIGAASTRAPSIARQPSSAVVSVGGTAIFQVNAAGTSTLNYQWQMSSDGGVTWSNLPSSGAFSGSTSATLTVSAMTSAISGDLLRCVISNSAGAVTTSAVSLVVPFSRLANLSILANITAVQSLVTGFSISGGSREILLRAVGPGLGPYLSNTVLAGSPALELFASNSSLVQSNRGWGGAAALTNAFAQVGAFPLPPNSADSAMLENLNGVYTADYVAASSGVGLLEIYDADSASNAARIVNLSAGYVAGPGADALTAGFVISGNTAKTLLIRGDGPALVQFGVSGVLDDPSLALFSGSAVLASNTGWAGDPNAAGISSAGWAVGAFPLPVTGDDSAMLVTLEPGAYTVQLSSPDGTSGYALIEIYEVN